MSLFFDRINRFAWKQVVKNNHIMELKQQPQMQAL